ncbi:unnamed protein product [Periconia digitata]|uniref:Rhodopsin domain-containing protein n=1 Tax=Periconia digitata TaxID=1303443 RepID=A0A9W4UEW7_9PLEO|nr:unnamed protein product [Periconia digitata]
MAQPSLPDLPPDELAKLPLMPNPSGAPPDFDTKDTTGPMNLGVTSVFLVIATVTLFLRLFTRFKITKRIGLDDLSAGIAFLFAAGTVGLEFYLVDQKVLGPHSWDVRLITWMSNSVIRSYVALPIVSNLANFFTKCSILLFLQRLFPRVACPKTAVALWVGLAANFVAYATLTMWLFVKCIPWKGQAGVPTSCRGSFQLQIGIGSSVVNATTDLYALALAIPSLWLLRMPLKRKISVIGVLAIGLCACGISLSLLASLAMRAKTDQLYDLTRKEVTPAMLGTIEPLLAITTASLPTLPSFWTWLSTEGRATITRLISGVGTTTVGIQTGHSSKKGSQFHIGDNHSLKSLNSHGMTLSSDVEHMPSAIQHDAPTH